MIKVKVDKGIPLPTREYTGAGPPGERFAYPWTEMECGDSFKVQKQSATVHTLVSQANRSYAPKRFTCRVEGKHFRVWRVT